MAVRNWTLKSIRKPKSLNEGLHLTANFSSQVPFLFFFFFDIRVNLVKRKFQWNNIKREIYGRVNRKYMDAEKLSDNMQVRSQSGRWTTLLSRECSAKSSYGLKVKV